MKFFIFFLLLFSSAPIKDSSSISMRLQFVVWNVGQGQWATLISDKKCQHFDAGGEFAPFAQIRSLCFLKDNEFWISHWDKDHLVFLNSKKMPRFAKACVHWPNFSTREKWKLKVQTSWPVCKRAQDRELSEIFGGAQARDANSESRVLVIKKTILVPGDSSQKEEKLWGAKVPAGIKIVVLGHHGSKTATSSLLLSKVQGALSAVASARRKKYGHPHFEVRARLKISGIPLLQTEKWGNIHFEQKKF